MTTNEYGSITLPIYIHSIWSPYSKEFHYSLLECADMSEYGYTRIETRQVTFVPPSRQELTIGAINALRKKQCKVRDEALANSARIEEEIQSLLCLEYKPE
jgi:hypothetical protein